MSKPLPKRLVEVLRLAAEGKTDKQIALELGISAGTVATHWKRLRGHFNSSSRTEVVAKVMSEVAHTEREEDLSDRQRLLYEIAERERAEERLRELNSKLEEVLRSREEMFAKTMGSYEKKQTEMQARLDDLETLNKIVCSFQAIPNCGTYGASWRKTWCSESMEQFGFTPQQVLNGEVTIFNTISPDDLARSLEDVAKASAGADRILCTHRFITPSGEVRHLMDFIRLRPLDSSGVGECEMLALDITEWIPLIQEKIDFGWPNLPLKNSPE